MAVSATKYFSQTGDNIHLYNLLEFIRSETWICWNLFERYAVIALNLHWTPIKRLKLENVHQIKKC